MILLFGTPADREMAYVCTRLSARVDFLLLDTRLYRHHFDLTWRIEDRVTDGFVSYGPKKVHLSDVCSVYLRQMNVPGPIEDPKGQKQVANSNSYASLAAFADSLPALVVNRPVASRSNGSKPYQQQIIARHGFKVPRTLVTTMPEEAQRFYSECHGRVIYKSVSHKRSIVSRLLPADLQRFEQLHHCPTQFQEYIAGADVRVHTVGKQIFATEIISDATDYRYAGQFGAMRKMRAVEISGELANHCLHLADGLGMVLSGIDLRRSPEGEYYCFEVNPSPGFVFYQTNTGQRIGDALVDLLCRGAA